MFIYKKKLNYIEIDLIELGQLEKSKKNLDNWKKNNLTKNNFKITLFFFNIETIIY
jgi:hypothetical protein